MPVKILIGLVCFAVLVCVGAYAVLYFYGRPMFNEQVGALTQRKVTVERINPVFPAGLELKGLNVEGLFKAGKIAASIELGPLFRGELVVAGVEVDQPEIFIVRKEDSSLDLPAMPQAAAPADNKGTDVGAASTGSRTAENRRKIIIIRKVTVRDGVFNLKDVKSGKDLVIDGIMADITNLPLGEVDTRTDFSMSAGLTRLDVPFVGSFAKVKGWLNWAGRDMEAFLQVMDDNGHEGLNLSLVSKDNDMEVKGKLNFNGKQQKRASGKRSGALENVVFGVLEATGTDISADISFKTSMDRFEIKPITLKGSVTKSGLQSETASGTIVDAFKSLGAELLKDKD